MPAFIAPALTALRSLSSVQKYLLAGTFGAIVAIIVAMGTTIWVQSHRLGNKADTIAALQKNINTYQQAQASNLASIDTLQQQLQRIRIGAELRRQAQTAALAAMRAELQRQADQSEQLRAQLNDTITDDMRACTVPADTWRVLRQTAGGG